ncbi:MAG TPA: VirB3 family type IV secretion system protein [Burkholderiaceae bacterium]|nr:VirB3 family type IV secretion system protein [Burkholderiaceae bacterium]
MARSSTFHPSLNRPRLVMGIGTEAFGLESSLAVMALNLHSGMLGVFVVPLHLFFRWLYRSDAVVLRAYLRYMKEADLYDPWTREPIVAMRPTGFGRGLHC